MLYILPPPRDPNPPSPWDSILCSSTTNTSSGNSPWSENKDFTRIRLINKNIYKPDGGSTDCQDEMDANRNPKSLSECYFAGKGTALVLPDAEAQKSNRRSGDQGSNIQRHLQSMFYLLRPEETLKMAVKLESIHPGRTRYLVVVSRMGSRGEESCLLGIDCNDNTTVGLVLKVLADTSIRLDGDGGFSVSICGRHHIFKPVSVQAMWSALQSLHKVSSKARELNYFPAGLTHTWVNYYEDRIESDRSCLNEWHAMDNLESRRPPSPDSIRTKPSERDETENVIRTTLKEIMMSVDLDEVTSKYIRNRLEEDLDMDLGEFKSFIDQEMITILGQMDAPTEVFDHVYLGSEWNASNYEELRKNGVGHILNVTKEIDNFFPGGFDYLNIRVLDDEQTNLLKHWDDTYKYISKARTEGSKVLVHCKMGISRSASVVIAYAMKAFNWDFTTAWQHVKEKRNCIKPNTSFMLQLETYRGILDAMKNKEKLQRSKSETNLKSRRAVSKNEKVLMGSEPTPAIQALCKCMDSETMMSGEELRLIRIRPKSWSPDNLTTKDLLSVNKSSPIFLSLEDLSQKSTSKESIKNLQTPDKKSFLPRHMLMACDNGESYSLSPNQIMLLPGQHNEQVSTSVKERINELEINKKQILDKKTLVLNLNKRFDSSIETGIVTVELNDNSSLENNSNDLNIESRIMLRTCQNVQEIWDPGEKSPQKLSGVDNTSDNYDLKINSVCECQPVWTSSTVLKTMPEPQYAVPLSNNMNKVPESQLTARSKLAPPTRKDSDPFSNQLDRVFDREEKKQQRMSIIPVMPVPELKKEDENRGCPSRQNSWSSYDSAVVMGYPTDVLSRHSSWGSGDTRTLPSRNSSWGSYDMRPRGPVHYVNEKGEKVLHPSNLDLVENNSDIPSHSGTIIRSKQRLEDSTNDVTREINSSHFTPQPSSENSSSETLFGGVCNISEPVPHVEVKNTDFVESLESCTYNNKQSCAISNVVDIPTSERRRTSFGLSNSAPEQTSINLFMRDCSLSRCASNGSSIGKCTKDKSIVNKAQCSIVKQHRSFLENINRESSTAKKSDIKSDGSNNSGKVRILKREFEAKTSTKLDSPNQGNMCIDSVIDMSKSKSRVKSVPTSPVAVHQDKEKSNSGDDLSLKNLIGLFENKQDTQVNMSTNRSLNSNKSARYSCIEVSVEKTAIRLPPTTLISNLDKNGSFVEKSIESDFKRPPISPVVRHMVTATVIASAARKQQQYGKSHPLAKLSIKPRHNNPVYNTM